MASSSSSSSSLSAPRRLFGGEELVAQLDEQQPCEHKVPLEADSASTMATTTTAATEQNHEEDEPSVSTTRALWPPDGSAIDEATIRLRVSSLSTWKTKEVTPFRNIAGLPWRLAAKCEQTKRTQHKRFFSVYIDCNPESESSLWSCDALVEFRLIAQDEGGRHFSRQFRNSFNYSSNNWGYPSFVEWDELVATDRPWARADAVDVEADVRVLRVCGVLRRPQFSFSAPIAPISDGVLVVSGCRLHVNKAYLALYSPYFSALFFGAFRESTMHEVTIENVVHDEFVELLHVIYPSHKPVTVDNVEFLLEMGDKFNIHYVQSECEKFLTTTKEIPVVTKLVWADQYNLSELHDGCVRSLETVKQIKSLRSSEEYKNFSDKTKAALLDKLLRLLPDG